MTTLPRASFKTPSHIYIFLTLIVSLFPLFLNLLGVDFSSDHKHFPWQEVNSLENPIMIDAMFHRLTGAFSHTILEWSSFCTAVFTVILSFTHFRVNRDVTTPIIGLALFFAGSMDAFHTLAADRLIEAVADNQNLIPFTWAICRIFNACIMIVGVGLLFYYPKKELKQKSFGFIILTSLAFGFAAYGLIHWAANSPNLPQTQFPDNMITRPYDVVPMVMFLLAGIFVYYPFYKRHPGIFSYALMMSVIPEVITEAHMAFGSSQLFDNHFNIAHFLKILGYLVPFIGLCFDYVFTHKKFQLTQKEMSLKNKELDLALNRAQKATQAKSDFLASMTHELRTPMNGVIGMANLLGDTKLSSEQKQQVDVIKSCANSLLIVINDILDFSKIEAGKMTVELVPFNVKKMCMTTVELVRFQAESQDLCVNFEMNESTPLFVKGDPNRLRQIILNFLSNAIKFTMQGEVKLILSYYEEKSCYRFSVKDTGVGIPEHVVDELFQPFSQADTSTSRKFGGTGLGLAISRKLSELMHGKIWLESVVGEGSIFYVELPLELVTQKEVEK